MKAKSSASARLLLILAWCSACSSEKEKTYLNVIEQQTLEASATELTTVLGRGPHRVEVVVPAGALPARGQVHVSVVTGVIRSGRYPASESAVLLEPVGTTFAVPVRFRQLVPPPPPGRRYRTVVVPDNDVSFVARGPARLVQAATAQAEGLQQWEGDCSGSGLWGLALEEPSDEGFTTDAAAADAKPAFAWTCTPAPVTGCAANQTCVLSCAAAMAGSACVAAGNKVPGELCNGPGECASGSVCYARGCGVSVCRRYCTADGECGTEGSCTNRLQCGGQDTGVRLCAQGCDPRGAATKGCAQGLRCFVLPGEVTDCDCVAPQRTGTDGTACKDSSTCGPGLVCVNSGTPVCRPVCRLSDPSTCQGGRMCQTLTNPDHRVFGACVPRP